MTRTPPPPPSLPPRSPTSSDASFRANPEQTEEKRVNTLKELCTYTNPSKPCNDDPEASLAAHTLTEKKRRQPEHSQQRSDR